MSSVNSFHGRCIASANFDSAAHQNTWNQTLLRQYWQTQRLTRSWASNHCDVLKTASGYCSRRITSSQSACMQSTLDNFQCLQEHRVMCITTFKDVQSISLLFSSRKSKHWLACLDHTWSHHARSRLTSKTRRIDESNGKMEKIELTIYSLIFQRMQYECFDFVRIPGWRLNLMGAVERERCQLWHVLPAPED